MCNPIFFLFAFLRSWFQSRLRLQAEIVALRDQVIVLRRSQKGRVHLRAADRLFWVWLTRLWSGWRSALFMVKPETVISWHRQGFRRYWTWRSRQGRLGRLEVSEEVQDLIRKMSVADPLWGAPRIHGELLKLGIEVTQATVAKYIVRQRKPPSQTWRTFLNNHVKDLVSTDFFVVPTLSFRALFVFVALAHHRRRVPSAQEEGPRPNPIPSHLVRSDTSAMTRARKGSARTGSMRSPRGRVLRLAQSSFWYRHPYIPWRCTYAGGGVKRGTVYGATDERGYRAVVNPVSVADFHATILHLMGLDYKQLFYEID